MKPARAAAVIWLLGASAFLACEAIAAASTPGYSYVDDYISDLGGAAVMNVGAFALHGMLFLLAATVFTRACPTPGWAGRGFVVAAAANAVGNIVVGWFPGGAPETAGHVHWHVIGAGMAILGGNIAVIIAGVGSGRIDASRCYRRASVAVGVIGIACLVTLIIDGANGSRVLPVGIVERGSVYSVIAWEIMTGVAILRRGATSIAVPARSAHWK